MTNSIGGHGCMAVIVDGLVRDMGETLPCGGVRDRFRNAVQVTGGCGAGRSGRNYPGEAIRADPVASSPAHCYIGKSFNEDARDAHRYRTARGGNR